MSLTSKIAHNTLLQVVGKGIAVLLGAVSVGVLTRYLGQAGYGQYTTVIAFVGFFGVLADLGLYIISVKKISEVGVDVDRTYSNIFTLRLLSALVFVGLAPLLVLLFPYPAVVKTGVAIATTFTLFVALNQVLTGLYQRYLAMVRSAVAEVVGKVVLVGSILLLVAGHASLNWILAATVAGSAAQFLVALVLARRFIHLRLRFDRDVWRSVLLESWPIAVTIALNLIYFRADTIILSLFRPAETVGLYGASYKVLEVLVAFPAMFAGLVLPLLTQAYSKGNLERFRTQLQRSFDFLALVALPMVAGGFLLAHPIMTIVGGADFTASGSILRVLLFATGSIFLGNLFGNTVVAIGRQRSMIGVYLAVAVGSLIGYLLLIPRFGVWGASGMTVATELAITLGSFLVIRRATHLGVRLVVFGKALAASLVMVGVLLLTRGWGVLPALLLGGASYAGALLLFRGVHLADIRGMLRLS